MIIPYRSNTISNIKIVKAATGQECPVYPYIINFPRERRGFLTPHSAWQREASLYYSISNCFAFVSGNVRTVIAASMAKTEAVAREKP